MFLHCDRQLNVIVARHVTLYVYPSLPYSAKNSRLGVARIYVPQKILYATLDFASLSAPNCRKIIKQHFPQKTAERN